jgi:hypothetical protein
MLDKFKAIQKVAVENPGDRGGMLIGYADLAQMALAAWDGGELAPEEMANPRLYRELWMKLPELGERLADSLLLAVLSGEAGPAQEALELMKSFNPSDAFDTPDKLAYARVRAKATARIIAGAAAEFSQDLIVVSMPTRIMDSQNRGVFLTLPERIEYVSGEMMRKWEPYLREKDVRLRGSLFVLQQVIIEKFSALEGPMRQMYARAMVDYTGGRRGEPYVPY